MLVQTGFEGSSESGPPDVRHLPSCPSRVVTLESIWADRFVARTDPSLVFRSRSLRLVSAASNAELPFGRCKRRDRHPLGRTRRGEGPKTPQFSHERSGGHPHTYPKTSDRAVLAPGATLATSQRLAAGRLAGCRVPSPAHRRSGRSPSRAHARGRPGRRSRRRHPRAAPTSEPCRSRRETGRNRGDRRPGAPDR